MAKKPVNAGCVSHAVDAFLQMMRSLMQQLDAAAMARLRGGMGARAAVWLRIPPVRCELSVNDGPTGEIMRTVVTAVRLERDVNGVDLLNQDGYPSVFEGSTQLFSMNEVGSEGDMLRLYAAIIESPYPVTGRRISQATVDRWAEQWIEEQDKKRREHADK